MTRPDLLVIGGGIVGIAIAREAAIRWPDIRVMLLEKEPRPAMHASGRNSGVLHAGFYYAADSLKARFCRDGNRRMREFCAERGLRLNDCGKLVVARDDSDLAALDELQRRADANGVALQSITAAEAASIEPRVRTHQRALFSPSTATVDPTEVTSGLAEDALRRGVELRTNVRVLGRSQHGVRSTDGAIAAGFVVNAAGLHADTIAHAFGFGAGLTLLPFKGLYLYSDEPPGSVRTNVYPVPDLRNPFLGVHFTVTVDGHSKIGPTAVPCLWREHYGGLSGFRAGEAIMIALREAALLLSAGFDFRGIALDEIRKYRSGAMSQRAGNLLSGVDPAMFRRWGRPGIRAQLLDLRTRKLVMDFHVEGDSRSLHVLNAVSPAFTCAMPFASHMCDMIERRSSDRQ